MTVDAAATTNPEHQNVIPPAVRKQMEEVEKMYAATKEAVTHEPPAADEQQGQGAHELSAETLRPGDDQTSGAPPQPEGAAPSAGDDFEQRFKSLQGRFEKERKEKRDLQERISSLENMISTMQAARPPQPVEDDDIEPLVTKEERDEFGEDLMEVIGKRAREVVAKELSELRRENQQLKDQISGIVTVQAKTTQQSLYQKLTAEVPDWRDINRDQAFLEWLDNNDPYAGRSRREMLQEAFSRQDANRVVNFFKGYKTEVVGTPPNAQNGSVTAPPAQPGSEGRPTLEQFAAPGKARSAPQDDLSAAKPIYTPADIAKFMAEKIAGKWKGREAEADRIERDIFQAQNEGRIKQ